MARNELTGVRFGRLTVKAFSHLNKWRASYWHCVCDCGNKVTVLTMSLSSGASKSCGCLAKEIRKESGRKVGLLAKHGHAGGKEALHTALGTQ